jgi:hypothetical protein
MKVYYRSRALADLEEIFQYIEKRNTKAARNVIDAIHAAIRTVPKLSARAIEKGLSGAASMRHQYRHRHGLEDASRGAAEHEFA